MAFNLTRAAGTLASAVHARATTGTIRAQLINVPARIARSARRLTLHLPADWPWEHALAAAARRHQTATTSLTPSTRPTGPDRRPRRGRAGAPGRITTPTANQPRAPPSTPSAPGYAVDPG